MKKDLAGIELSSDGFMQLALLCEQDPKFPRTYRDWLDLLDRAHVEATAAGQPTAAFALSPDDFKEWCQLVGIVPCIEALRAFVIVKRAAAH